MPCELAIRRVVSNARVMSISSNPEGKTPRRFALHGTSSGARQVDARRHSPDLKELGFEADPQGRPSTKMQEKWRVGASDGVIQLERGRRTWKKTGEEIAMLGQIPLISAVVLKCFKERLLH